MRMNAIAPKTQGINNIDPTLIGEWEKEKLKKKGFAGGEE